MIVGMVDVFEELIIEPIEKYNQNNENKQKMKIHIFFIYLI